MRHDIEITQEAHVRSDNLTHIIQHARRIMIREPARPGTKNIRALKSPGARVGATAFTIRSLVERHVASKNCAISEPPT